MAAVARLVRRIHAIEHAIWFPGNAHGTHGHALELPQERRTNICAVLLELHLRLDADIFEIALHQLYGIKQVRTVAISSRDRRLQTLRKAGFRQQTPGLLGVILIVPRALTELINGQGPLCGATGNSRSWFAPDPDCINEPLTINRHGDGAPHAHVVEGRHIRAHVDYRPGHVGQEVLVHQVGMALLEGVQILLAYTPITAWTTVDLPGAVHRQAG